MTPKQYLDRYTYLAIPSPLDGSRLNCGLTGYGSGWNLRNGKAGAGAAIQREYAVFRDALRKAHHDNAHTPCGPMFYFSEKPLAQISRLEEFLADSLVRAFVGKGSPDEITDALRLALAVGRIGTGRDVNGRLPARMTVQEYGSATSMAAIPMPTSRSMPRLRAAGPASARSARATPSSRIASRRPTSMSG